MASFKAGLQGEEPTGTPVSGGSTGNGRKPPPQGMSSKRDNTGKGDGPLRNGSWGQRGDVKHWSGKLDPHQGEFELWTLLGWFLFLQEALGV